MAIKMRVNVYAAPSQDNCPAGRRAELMAETIMDNCNGDNNASLILRT